MILGPRDICCQGNNSRNSLFASGKINFLAEWNACPGRKLITEAEVIRPPHPVPHIKSTLSEGHNGNSGDAATNMPFGGIA
jgi:hypothetical protein